MILYERTLINKYLDITYIFKSPDTTEEVHLGKGTQADLSLSIGFLRPNTGVKGVSGKLKVYSNFQSDRGINLLGKIKESLSKNRPCFLNLKLGYASIEDSLEFTFKIFRIQFNRDSSTNTPTYTLEFVTLDNFDKIYRTSASLNKSFDTTNTFEDVLLYILNSPDKLANKEVTYKNLEDLETLGIIRDDSVVEILKNKLPKRYNLIFDNTSAYTRAYSQALETFYQELNRTLPKGKTIRNKVTTKGVKESVIEINSPPTVELIASIDDSSIIGDVAVSSNPYMEFTTIFDPLYIVADAITIRSQYLSMLTFSSDTNYKLLDISQYLIDKDEELEYTLSSDVSNPKFLLSCDIDFSTKVNSATPTMVMRLTEKIPTLNPNKTKEKL